MSRVNGQVEVDRGQMVWELIEKTSVERAAEVCGQEGVVHAGSWSQRR